MMYQSQVGHTPEPWPERMPGKVRWAVAGMWLHVVVNAIGAVTLFLDARSRAVHGQDGTGGLLLAGTVALLLVTLLAACAIMTMRGTPSWARSLAVGLELLYLLGGLITLLGALIAQDVLGVVIAVVFSAIIGGIVWLLFSWESGEWFCR